MSDEIERWELRHNCYGVMVVVLGGDYVKYADHLAAIDTLRRERDALLAENKALKTEEKK
jgi:hypothetical protein